MAQEKNKIQETKEFVGSEVQKSRDYPNTCIRQKLGSKER
jgi:hypothetical protein